MSNPSSRPIDEPLQSASTITAAGPHPDEFTELNREPVRNDPRARHLVYRKCHRALPPQTTLALLEWTVHLNNHKLDEALSVLFDELWKHIPDFLELKEAVDKEIATTKAMLQERLDQLDRGDVQGKPLLVLPENAPTESSGMTWQQAAQQMERLRGRGEPFTSQQRLAKRLGCSSGTINKAIKNTPALKVWADRQVEARPGPKA